MRAMLKGSLRYWCFLLLLGMIMLASASLYLPSSPSSASSSSSSPSLSPSSSIPSSASLSARPSSTLSLPLADLSQSLLIDFILQPRHPQTDLASRGSSREPSDPHPESSDASSYPPTRQHHLDTRNLRWLASSSSSSSLPSSSSLSSSALSSSLSRSPSSSSSQSSAFSSHSRAYRSLRGRTQKANGRTRRPVLVKRSSQRMYRKFHRAMNRKGRYRGQQSHVEELFKLFDMNADNYIERDEFQAILQLLGIVRPPH